MWQRVTAFGGRVRAAAGPMWARLRAIDWLFPFRWILLKLWAALCAFGRLLRWLFVPRGDTPLDLLKQYVSVLIALMGALALLWSAKQIAYPPLVVTVAKMPEPLEKEFWINPEIARTLIGQIEGLRAAVKDERDPTFEAVLNSPNIVVKTGEWSLNVQEQILTPLGSLIGRGQGEVHLAITCYHPGCLRASDADCRNPVAPAKAGDEAAIPKQYLCLRLTADIMRGKAYRRVTPRLVLGNDDADLTEPMARVAEAITAVADPATAALYFYRRMREEKAATTSFVYTPDTVAQLFNEASKAADQAESNDAVSACWAHSIHAHLAIGRREFEIANIFLQRARDIHWWQHLWQFTLPVDCDRLITIAEMEFARQLSHQPEDRESTSTYDDDRDGKRVLAAYQHINRVIGEFDDPFAVLRDKISRSASSGDVKAALNLARAEIGLNFFSLSDQCTLAERKEKPAAFEYDSDIDFGATNEETEAHKQVRNEAWDRIKEVIDELVKPDDNELEPLTRQATLDFLQQYASNTSQKADDPDCAGQVVSLAKTVFMRHAYDPKVMQFLVSVTEAAALKKTELLNRPAEVKDRSNPQLDNMRWIYQRIADTGADPTGSAINKLAFIAEGTKVDQGDDAPVKPGEKRYGPGTQTLQNVVRAWRRYQRERYPAETRPQAEYAVAFWGSVLMRAYPTEFMTLDPANVKDLQKQLEQDKDAEKMEALKDFLPNMAEYKAALSVLYPNAKAATLSDLTQIPEIGARIGCMCMLSYVTLKNELADFFILRLNRWQRQTDIQVPICRRDLIPRLQVDVPRDLRRKETMARLLLRVADSRLRREPRKADLIERRKTAYSRYTDARKDVTEEVDKQKKTIKEWIDAKQLTIDESERLCYVSRTADAPSEPAAVPQSSSQSPQRADPAAAASPASEPN